MQYKSIAVRLRSIICIVILLLLISILNYYLTGLADSIEERYHRITDLETLFAHIVADEWVNLNNSLSYNEPDIHYEKFKHDCEFFSKNCGEDIIAERQKIFECILNIEKQSAKLYIDVRSIMSDMISTVKYTHEHHIAYLKNLMRRGVVKQDYDTGESFMRSPFQSASELDIIKAAVNIQTKLFEIYEIFQELHEADNPMQIKKKFIKKIQEFRSSINRFEDYSLDAQDGLLVEELLINQKLFEQMFSDLTFAEHKKKKLKKTLDENRRAAWKILNTEKNRLQTASYNTSKGKKILLVISILFTISMIWWIMLAGKRIISQINRTVMETEKIRNDYSFQIRIDPEVFHEFKIVFKALNSMAGTVNEHILQLDETRSTLEHRVQERTSELTKANKELKNKILERILAGEQIKNLRNLLINIINSMPSVLICVDNEGKVTLWNAGAEQRTGITLAEARGYSVINLFPQLLKTTGMIKEAIDKQEIQKKEKFAEKLDGKTRFSDVTVYPLKGNDCNGAVIRIDDVTERVTIEEVIIQSEKMMSVGGLAAGMAHEINNPLAGILQHTQIIRNRISKDLPANTRAAEECGIKMDTVRAYMEKREILKLIESVMDSGGACCQNC
ncbi:PAS domain S-box protein [Desulfobacterales bacterium HSG16]|nr:PAS domain S-box protein [Desulfobacterales bacterium HSG16]